MDKSCVSNPPPNVSFKQAAHRKPSTTQTIIGNLEPPPGTMEACQRLLTPPRWKCTVTEEMRFNEQLPASNQPNRFFLFPDSRRRPDRHRHRYDPPQRTTPLNYLQPLSGTFCLKATWNRRCRVKSVAKYSLCRQMEAHTHTHVS